MYEKAKELHKKGIVQLIVMLRLILQLISVIVFVLEVFVIVSLVSANRPILEEKKEKEMK